MTSTPSLRKTWSKPVGTSPCRCRSTLKFERARASARVAQALSPALGLLPARALRQTQCAYRCRGVGGRRRPMCIGPLPSGPRRPGGAQGRSSGEDATRELLVAKVHKDMRTRGCGHAPLRVEVRMGHCLHRPDHPEQGRHSAASPDRCVPRRHTAGDSPPAPACGSLPWLGRRCGVRCHRGFQRCHQDGRKR
jgi:hypothetical protein